MKCEHCGWRPAMRDMIVCRHCWMHIFGPEDTTAAEMNQKVHPCRLM